MFSALHNTDKWLSHFWFPTWMSAVGLLSYSSVVVPLFTCSFSHGLNKISFYQYFPKVYWAFISPCSVESRVSLGFRCIMFRKIMLAPWQHQAFTVSEELILVMHQREKRAATLQQEKAARHAALSIPAAPKQEQPAHITEVRASSRCIPAVCVPVASLQIRPPGSTEPP